MLSHASNTAKPANQTSLPSRYSAIDDLQRHRRVSGIDTFAATVLDKKRTFTAAIGDKKPQ